MIKKIDTVVIFILFLILLAAPTQYSFKLANANVSIVDPLIWVGGLFYFISIILKNFSKDEIHAPVERRFHEILKKLLPNPENIAFVILIALSLTKAENLKESVKELLQAIEYLLVGFLLFSKVELKTTTLNRLKLILLTIITIVSCVALFQYFDDSQNIMAVQGTFGNRNIYGGFLAVTLPFVMALLILSKGKQEKIWCGLILAIAGVSLLSGAAALGLLFASSLVCVLVSPRVLTIWLAIIFIFAGFILPKLPRNNLQVFKDSISLYDNQAQVTPRYTEWQASLQMWDEDPLLGVGLGNYQSQIGMNYGFLSVVEGPKEPDHNNLFLVIASSTGILGLLGLIGMLFMWFRRNAVLFFNKQTLEQKIWSLGAIGAVSAFAITSIWTALMVRGVFIILVIIVGIALNHESNKI